MFVDAISESKENPNDPRNRSVIHQGHDAFDANLATPINASGFTKAYISNLPAYRRGITTFRRGLEVGMAHGYWLVGPFIVFSPLRHTDVAALAGLLATIGLLIISTLAISLYGASNPPGPTPTITTPNPPEGFNHSEGWNEYGSGFLIGGIGGALFAYFLIANLPPIKELLNL